MGFVYDNKRKKKLKTAFALEFFFLNVLITFFSFNVAYVDASDTFFRFYCSLFRFQSNY